MNEKSSVRDPRKERMVGALRLVRESGVGDWTAYDPQGKVFAVGSLSVIYKKIERMTDADEDTEE